jgi:hypothetical protein
MISNHRIQHRTARQHPIRSATHNKIKVISRRRRSFRNTLLNTKRVNASFSAATSAFQLTDPSTRCSNKSIKHKSCYLPLKGFLVMYCEQRKKLAVV